MQSVIPGLTRNPCFFWIPAPALNADPGFAGMTRSALINVAMYETVKEEKNDDPTNCYQCFKDSIAGKKDR